MGGFRIMIRYRKKITVKTNQNDDIEIQTDMGQTWRALLINSSSPVTDWLSKSSQNNLAHWQKDMIKVILDAHHNELSDSSQRNFDLYHVYQKGQGYQSRSSDVMLMRIPDKNVWFFSTSDNTWLFEQKYENFTIDVEISIGGVLDKEIRQQLYDWSDRMRGIKTDTVRYTDQDYINKGLH
jgi:hypothetical protein